MISVTEARARILEGLAATPAEIIPLMEGAGRVSAAPVVARHSHPPADVSAMDGYAVRSEDAAPGARLTLIGAAPAGHPFAGKVGTGEAVRLFTGSVVPEGADQRQARAWSGILGSHRVAVHGGDIGWRMAEAGDHGRGAHPARALHQRYDLGRGRGQLFEDARPRLSNGDHGARKSPEAPPDLATTRRPSTTIPRSTALHMS
jgi:hypothetical protein